MLFSVTRRLVASLVLAALPLIAAAQTVITLRADSARRTIAPSSKVTVPVILDMSAAGGTNLALLTTGVTFGSSRLTFDSVKTAGFGSLTPNTASAASGSVTLGVIDATGTTTTQTLATMYFTASATTGGTTIAFAPTVAGSASGANIFALLRARALDICVAPSGKWGDVNGDSVATPLGDGFVNIIDAQQIARYSVGLTVSNRPGLVARGDVTNDGAVNIIDAQQIARFSVGLSAAARVNTSAYTPPAVSTVTLLPSTPTVAVGQTVQLTGTALDAASTPLTGCAVVTYASSDTTKARVSSTGLVSGLAVGTATITASSGGQSAQVTVTVTVTTGTVPASLQRVQGDQQWGRSGTAYGLRPQVLVVDAQSRPVPGVSVTFAATGGFVRAAGSMANVASVSAISDALGIAQPGDWVAGTTTILDGVTLWAGTGTLTATVTGLTAVTFTGTALQSEVGGSNCVLTSAGATYCVGEYVFTNLYDRQNSDTTLGNLPVAVPNAVPLASLSPNFLGEFTCGVASTGQAYCWGWNQAGQLGDGTTTRSSGFRAVAGGLSFTKISSSHLHTCAITTAGAAYCWGLGQYGQLGNGTIGQISTTPVAVSGGLVFADIATTTNATCGVTTNGQTWCWGQAAFIDSTNVPVATPKQLATAPAFSKLAINGAVVCGITTGGALSCAGAASTYLGDGNTTTNRYTTFAPTALPVNAREVYGDPRHFCAVGTDNGLYCWGSNAQGQLGVGDNVARSVPTLVGYANPKRVQMQNFGTCYQTQNNQPYCFGSFAIGDGIAGIYNSIARLTPVPMKWVEGTAGAAASIVVNGGGGQSAVLGAAVPVPPSVLVTDYNGAPVSGVSVTFAVASGGGSVTGATAATNASGIATVGSWTLGATAGANTLTATVSGLPVVVFSAFSTLVPASVTIASGDAQVQSSSLNYPGQLTVLVKDVSNAVAANVSVTFTVASGGGFVGGVASTVVPTDTAGLARVTVTAGAAGVQTITATVAGVTPVTFTLRSVGLSGLDTRCELTNAGAAYCWGFNTRGQIGDGTTTSKLVPTAVGGGLVFASIAEGAGDHACGLTAAGVAYCWGANSYGQLGDNSITDRTAPTPVAGGLVFTKLALARQATCGRTAAGALYCWGWANSGTYGDGAVGIVRLIPTQVTTGSLIFNDISMGSSHVCGVTSSGAMYCWGQNSNGQLGDGTSVTRTAVTAVSGGLSFSSVAVGISHTCGITTSGAAYCWGLNSYGQMGNGGTATTFLPTAVSGGLTFASISTTNNSTCARTTAGVPWCWGWNGSGQLGDGTTTSRLSPTLVLGGLSVGAIRVLGTATCARLSAGNRQPFCWGQNNSGQLGDATTVTRYIPGPVTWVEGTAGTAVSLAIVGPVSFSGAAGVALPTLPAVQVRDYANTPVAGVTVTWTVTSGGGSIAAPGTSVTNASGIATAPAWTLGAAIGTTNTLTASALGLQAPVFTATATSAPASITITGGDNQYATSVGQLPALLAVLVKDGANNPLAGATVVFNITGSAFSFSTASSVLSASATTNASGVASLTAYAYSSTAGTSTIAAAAQGIASVTFTAKTGGNWGNGATRCDLTSAGAAYCWGDNTHGQIGDGTTTNRNLPTAVGGGIIFASIAEGAADHACGVTSAGAAYCWGANFYGQIGDGTTTDRYAPTAVGSGLVFTRLAVSSTATCGVTTAGVLYCWGWTGFGFFGDGTVGIIRPTPTPVTAGAVTFSRVAIAVNHVCAISTAGAMYCWGNNGNGQLGDNTYTNHSVVTSVNDGRSYASVATAGSSSCGVTTAGTAFCWGNGGNGTIGDGGTTNRSVPTATSGGLSVAQLGITLNGATCAITTSGAGYCWGNGNSGMVGDGTAGANRTAPTPVLGGITFGALSVRGNSICARAAGGNRQPFCWGQGGFGQMGNGANNASSSPIPVSWVEGTAGTGVSMAYYGPQSFSAAAGMALAAPPAVQVRDYANNPVAGVTVTWTVSAGGGSIAAPGTSVTNASGIATAPVWTIGATVGATNTLTASATGLPSPVFTATATSAPASITISGGDTQYSPSVMRLPAPLAVLVKDGANSPMVGATVVFTITGNAFSFSNASSVLSGSAVTNASGIASVSPYAYSNSAGTSTISATAQGLTPVTFTARTSGYLDGRTQCELTSAGAAYCWGVNSHGQIGDGTTTNRNTPVAVGGGLTFASLADGSADHACGLTAAGAAYCWGSNFYGQIGDGTTTDRSAPTLVPGGLVFSKLAVSGMATCGLTTGSAVYCWGWTGYGLFGDGVTGIIRPNPTQVTTGGVTFTKLALGFQHVCAISASGAMYCWGYNNGGLLGDNTNTNRSVLTAVNDGRTYASVAAEGSNSCGVTTTGALFCWGYGGGGNNGNGSTLNSLVPTAVSGGLSVAQVTVNRLGTACALTTAGAAYCWGVGSWGLIGDGSVGVTRLVPTAVSGGINFSSIAGHGSHTCGRASGGNRQPFCWGAGDWGEMGNGSSILNNAVPTPVSWVEGTAGTAVSMITSGPSAFGAAAGTALTVPPAVKVADYANNGVAGVTVTWTVTAGGGSIAAPGTSVTNASGIATAPAWTLGATVGATNTLTASATGLPSPVFTATATVAVAAINIWGGNNQWVFDTQGGTAPLWVQVLDGSNQPLNGVTVAWTVTTGSGTLTTTSSVTAASGGVQGLASNATWMPPVAAGTAYTVTATVGALAPVTFTSQRIALNNSGTLNPPWTGCRLLASGQAACWGGNGFGAVGDGTTTDRRVPTIVAGGIVFASIAKGAAGFHQCGLTAAGAAYCWGWNSVGQLGDGTQTNRTQPTLVSGGLTFASIAVGPGSTCGVTTGGATYCWGYGGISMRGDGGVNDIRLVPTLVNTGGRTFTSLTVGMRHLCALDASAQAFCWGENYANQLGNGTANNAPQPVATNTSLRFTQLTSGLAHMCGVTTAATVACWGVNSYGNIGNGTNTNQATPLEHTQYGGATEVRAGFQHGCARNATQVWCWGYNNVGQVGDGTIANALSPFMTIGSSAPNSLDGVSRGNACASTVNGMWCWGQWVPDGTGANRSVPTWVPWPDAPSPGQSTVSVSPTSVATGGTTTVTVTLKNPANTTVTTATAAAFVATPSAGSVGAFSCVSGVCTATYTAPVTAGSPTIAVTIGGTPVQQSPVTLTVTAASIGFVALTTGGGFSCGLTGAGAAYCWGSNAAYALGGSSGNKSTPTVASGLVLKAIWAGQNHVCGVTASGAANCWGYNGNMQLGDSQYWQSYSLLPLPVDGGLAFAEVKPGASVTCGLTNAAAYCWGGSGGTANGQLGTGVLLDYPSPTAVVGGLTFSMLSAGAGSVCGVTTSGNAYCWGGNNYGQLGTADTLRRLSPTAVQGGILFNTIDVSRTGNHVCGVALSGAAYCWGPNDYGEGGTGVQLPSPALTPVPVQGGLTFKSISTGAGYSCGLTTGGMAYCWGANYIGQLGDGTTQARLSPVAVQGGLTFTSLVAGSSHTCGLTTVGDAYCWGRNYFGELGDGTTTDRWTPVAVVHP